MTETTCINCGIVANNAGKGLCKKCYDQRYHYPKKKIERRLYRIRFKDKRVTLKKLARIGKCQNLFCNSKKINITNTHHKRYHDDDPAKDTIELCINCHRKITKYLKNKSRQ